MHKAAAGDEARRRQQLHPHGHGFHKVASPVSRLSLVASLVACAAILTEVSSKGCHLRTSGIFCLFLTMWQPPTALDPRETCHALLCLVNLSACPEGKSFERNCEGRIHRLLLLSAGIRKQHAGVCRMFWIRGWSALEAHLARRILQKIKWSKTTVGSS